MANYEFSKNRTFWSYVVPAGLFLVATTALIGGSAAGGYALAGPTDLAHLEFDTAHVGGAAIGAAFGTLLSVWLTAAIIADERLKGHNKGFNQALQKQEE